MVIHDRRMKIMGSIAEAFSKIEVKDRRVTRINTPQECFMELITRRDALSRIIDLDAVPTPPPLRRNHKRELGRLNLSEQFLRDEAHLDPAREQFPDTAGKIWGANIYFTKDKIEVLSDDLRYRSGPGGSTIERVSPTITEKVDIDIKFFYMGNLTIHVKSRARPIAGISDAEAKAIETLREMITETEYRKFITHGFILVKGQSGYIYQIFRTNSHTKVWKNGQIVKEICVKIQDRDVPPTDNVIAHKILIETSEEDFEKLGNVYKMTEAA